MAAWRTDADSQRSEHVGTKRKDGLRRSFLGPVMSVPPTYQSSFYSTLFLLAVPQDRTNQDSASELTLYFDMVNLVGNRTCPEQTFTAHGAILESEVIYRLTYTTLYYTTLHTLHYTTYTTLHYTTLDVIRKGEEVVIRLQIILCFPMKKTNLVVLASCW